MTKEEFYKRVNQGRYPKYYLSQIKKGGKPQKECSAIICTETDHILLAKYENGSWQQAHFTSAATGPGYSSQSIYYTAIHEKVIYFTDGKAKDSSRPQFE